MAPTGPSIQLAQITIERCRDGQIVAHQRLIDELAVLRQLGVGP